MATKDGDPYVLNVQQWVNNTYRGKTGYTEIPENGKTGWTTIYALLHALQIELGITATADNFGTGTVNAFNRDYPNGVKQQLDGDTTKKNIYGIIQGALLCKGYSIGASTPTCNFYGGTGDAIKSLKADAGLTDTTSTVTLNIMKALMSMDYFYSYDTSERTQNIINMQRYLNRNYEDYIGLCPCDGVYGRRTNKALIYAIQAEENLPTSVANGNFGDTTKKCCPTVPYNNAASDYYGNKYSTSKINKFIKLINIGLYVNGIGDGNLDDTLDGGYVKQFQSKYALPINGIVDLTTWLSLFISSGDTTRSAKACDCATILTAAKAKTLYEEGYRYVGRYLANVPGGRDKELSREELLLAFNAGLRIFPIQQGTANTVSFFTEANAEEEVKTAYEHAISLGIPNGTIIYFAVDCDPQDTDITNMIIPYFKKIKEKMKSDYSNTYRVGVYGTRNVCTRVSEKGYAETSFVSDMSTGFSGNLGFSIPDNWAFDQFATVTVGSGSGQIEIDKDGFSGVDSGINWIHEGVVGEYEDPDYSQLLGDDVSPEIIQPDVMLNVSDVSFNVYATKFTNNIINEAGLQESALVANQLGGGTNYSRWLVDGNKVGEIKPGDFFIRFHCRNSGYLGLEDYKNQYGDDAVHKVLFRTANGEVRYGYIQEFKSKLSSTSDTTRYGMKKFNDYIFDGPQNKLIDKSASGTRQFYIVMKQTNYVSADGNKSGTLKYGDM